MIKTIRLFVAKQITIPVEIIEIIEVKRDALQSSMERKQTRMRFFRIAFFLFMLPAVLLVGSALAQDEVIAQTYGTVNVRRGPGTQYDIIGQLTSGNDVQITGRSDAESNWLRINFDGSEGWVAYFTVSVLGNTEQLPVVVPRVAQETLPPRLTVTPTTEQASGSIFVTAYRAVNVRSGPGSEYISVGTLATGSIADVTGRSNDSEWLRIDFSGAEGWVAFFVVSLNGLIEEIAVVQPSPDAATEAPGSTVAVITRYNINLRENPRLDSPIIQLVPFDTTLQAEARSETRSAWLR
ncbi:MAG: SH3 domain-containing protein, partial [Chloroflexota bacterium]